jgi:rare lipoprotein A (peptidoglycan hydrolase)
MPQAFSLAATQAGPPANCELGINNQAKSCTQRCDCGGAACGSTCDNRSFFYGNDLSCAKSRIGVPTYSAKITIFKDAKCAGGACDHSKAGLAHRTFPLGCYVEVCNLDKPNRPCAVAVVMDRGPNVCLADRTVDANLGLARDLALTGSNRVSYTLLSCPGIAESVKPSGPAEASLQALLEAQNSRNQLATNLPVGYTAVETPWGPGYMGTPPAAGSSAYGALGGMLSGANQNTGQNAAYTQRTQNPQYPTTPPSTATTPGTPSNPPPVGAGRPGAAIASVIVQPKQVNNGKTIIVSWTSVNMRPNSCDVTMNGQQFFGANEGAQPLRTTTEHVGMLLFVLRCTSIDGEIHQTRASVEIK